MNKVPIDVPREEAIFILEDIICSDSLVGPNAITITTIDIKMLLSVYGVPINEMGAAASIPALFA